MIVELVDHVHRAYSLDLLDKYELFKALVLACRSTTDEKNTIRIDRNWPEWPGIIPQSNKKDQFVHIWE